MTKLKVAVRVRPLSARETEIESVPVISVLNNESLEITNIKVPEQNVGDSRERVKRFTFDYCFHESCSQNYIFEKIEKIISQSMKQRKHSCVLAYGQSSTGKTHTMMGVPHDPGFIPSFCQQIFDYVQEMAIGEEALNMKVTVSYLEIYNEKVRDLLNSSNGAKKTSLKIREHPKRGPYVQGLSEHLVNTTSDLHHWLEEGNKHRKVAATHSNPQSSRSHSVFVVNCDGVKLNLIDLAGSERAANRCFNLSRFKEGSNINKSIVALGNVISALADQTLKHAKGIRRRFVPYRDSILTWLLKDILGGNSNTVMVATVSPSSACYNETVNTLRFGQRAKNIIFRPVVHEDPKEKTIRDLRAEIFRLKELLKSLQLPCLNQMYFQKDINRDTKEDVSPKTNLNTTNCVLSNLTNKFGVVERTLFANDELIPVIDVKVEQKEPKATFIMSSNKIDNDKCASDDSTISTKSVASNQSSEQCSSRRSSLRTESLPKSASTLTKTLSKKQSPKTLSSENLSRRSDSKINSFSKNSARSQVVAAVTSRLYNKVKKKEVATDTDDINTYNLSVFPAELMITENARTRLRNITRRALRANRMKNQDIQTDFSPIVRMKEASTNTSDLKIHLEELKNVETMTSTINSKDASVDCCDPIGTVTDMDNVKSLLITRSCGTQFSKEDSRKKQIVPKPSTLISFTKYLKGTKENVATDAIYTNVVNINISNNYLQGDKPSDSVSCDSLDHFESQSAYTVTPDLLSNHPPLETSSKEVQTWYHGSVIELQDEFSETVEYANEDTMKVYNKAKCSVIPNHSVTVPSVKMLKGHVAETHRTTGQEEEFCLPLKEFKVVPAKPRIIHSGDNEYDDVVIVNEPHVFQHVDESKENIESLKKTGTISTGLTKKLLQCERGEAQRMVTAMSAFLEEATDMMSKISEKVEEPPRAYDMQITVSGLKTCKSLTKKKKSARSEELCIEHENCIKQDQQPENKKCFRDKSSQTILPFTYNCSTQFDMRDSPPFPINKYEIPFEAACSQLEKTLSLVQDHKDLSIESDALNIDLDTPPCFSDYGSLPKVQKKKYRTWSMSPKSYLKQLTAMRKDIVECSRDYMKSFSEHVKSSGDHVSYSGKFSDGDFIKNDT